MGANPDGIADVMQAFFAREGKALPMPTVKKLMAAYRFDRVAVSPQDVPDTMESARGLFERGRLKQRPDFSASAENTFAERAAKALK